MTEIFLTTFFISVLLFFLGSVLMRSAGCIVNDIFDKEFDSKVYRTKNRPRYINVSDAGLTKCHCRELRQITAGYAFPLITPRLSQICGALYIDTRHISKRSSSTSSQNLPVVRSTAICLSIILSIRSSCSFIVLSIAKNFLPYRLCK